MDMNTLEINIKTQPAESNFHLGTGTLYTTYLISIIEIKIVSMPVLFGFQYAKLMTHEIDSYIQLLMSHISLKCINSWLDFLINHDTWRRSIS